MPPRADHGCCISPFRKVDPIAPSLHPNCSHRPSGRKLPPIDQAPRAGAGPAEERSLEDQRRVGARPGSAPSPSRFLSRSARARCEVTRDRPFGEPPVRGPGEHPEERDGGPHEVTTDRARMTDRPSSRDPASFRRRLGGIPGPSPTYIRRGLRGYGPAGTRFRLLLGEKGCEELRGEKERVGLGGASPRADGSIAYGAALAGLRCPGTVVPRNHHAAKPARNMNTGNASMTRWRPKGTR